VALTFRAGKAFAGNNAPIIDDYIKAVRGLDPTRDRRETLWHIIVRRSGRFEQIVATASPEGCFATYGRRSSGKRKELLATETNGGASRPSH